jgi:hypothetical protein
MNSVRVHEQYIPSPINKGAILFTIKVMVNLLFVERGTTD